MGYGRFAYAANMNINSGYGNKKAGNSNVPNASGEKAKAQHYI